MMLSKHHLFRKGFIAVSLIFCFIQKMQGQDIAGLNKKDNAGGASFNSGQENNIPLKDVLSALEIKYNISILYIERAVQNKMIPSFKAGGFSNPDTALQFLLGPIGLAFKKITPTQIIITETPGIKAGGNKNEDMAHASPGLLNGTVKNEKGEPMPGVSVLVIGRRKGTVTDAMGNYQLALGSGTHQVFFTSVGYNNFSTAVTIEDRVVIRNVTLHNAIADLSEIIVAVGSRASQRTFTTTTLPVDNITAAELQTTGQLSLDRVLQYKAPSFNTVNMPVHDATSLSDPYEIRGMGPSRTLVLINGKRKNAGSLVYIQTSPGRGETETDLSAIPTEAIKRVEILRDGASAQYGSDAIAGVMNIILKDRFEYANFKVASGITHKGDGFSVSTSLNSGANIGSRGFVNYTVNFVKEDRTNRPGKVDAVQDNIDLGAGTEAGLAQAKAFLARYPDAGNINGTPANTAARFLVNAGFPVSDNTSLYADAAYVYKKVQSYANYRTPYWKEDPYNLFHDPGTEYLGFRPTFDGDLNDYNATLGFKNEKNHRVADISITVGGNRQLYAVDNTWNPSLGAQSPLSFRPGGYAFNHIVGNMDFTKAVNDKLSVGFGSEFRREIFRSIAGDVASFTGGGPVSFSGISRDNAGTAYRSNIGGYADLSYDLSKSVLINGTVRQEYYSDFGNAFVWKVSGRAKIAGDKLTLRSSLSTGFRAPSLHQINLQIAQQIFVPGQGVQTKGVVSNKSVQAYLLGVPPLKPERSLNFTTGFGLRPSKNFSLTLDYYNIDIRDRIILSSNVGHTSLGNTELDAFLRANNYIGLSFFTNGIRTNTQGIDLVANYRDIRIGAMGMMTINLAANYTLANRLIGGVSNPKLIADAGQEIFDYMQEALLLTSRPKYKAILGGDLLMNKWDFHLNNTLFGPATLRNEGLDRNIRLVFMPKLITDMNLSHRFSNRLEASLAVNNLLNILPEYELKALSGEGQAVLSNPVRVRQNVNAVTFNGRYGIVTYDGSHFSQLGTTFLVAVNVRL